jgi:hypothetical protein
MSTTPNLLISHIAASQNQKEVTANTAFDDLDLALTNVKTTNPVANSDYTVPTADFTGNFVLVLVGSWTSQHNVILPSNKRPFVISNQLTKNALVKVGSAAATVLVPPDSKYYLLYCDGSNSVFPIQPTTLAATSLSLLTDARTTTTETIQDSDRFKLITFSNASAIAASIAQAGASSAFLNGWFAWLQNLNSGIVTVTPATSTIDGASTLVLRQNEGLLLVSDGTNYHTMRGKMTLPQYTVANLPTPPSAVEGDLAYATNGLKTGETTGFGTGVPVYFSTNNPSLPGVWRVFSTDAQVQS